MKNRTNMFWWTMWIWAGLLILGLSILLTSVTQIEKQLGVGANLQPVITLGQFNLSKVDRSQLLSPGILPDHPFYLAKMIRDKIWLWFTWDVDKKSQLLFYLSSKRLAAAQALADKGKVGEAITAATKGQIYLSRAIDIGFKNDSIYQRQRFEQIGRVMTDYKEIILNLDKLANEESKEQTNKLIKDLDSYTQKISAFIKVIVPQEIEQSDNSLEPRL